MEFLAIKKRVLKITCLIFCKILQKGGGGICSDIVDIFANQQKKIWKTRKKKSFLGGKIFAGRGVQNLLVCKIYSKLPPPHTHTQRTDGFEYQLGRRQGFWMVTGRKIFSIMPRKKVDFCAVFAAISPKKFLCGAFA